MNGKQLIEELTLGERVVFGKSVGNVTRVWCMGNVPCVQITFQNDSGLAVIKGETPGRKVTIKGTKVERLIEHMGAQS